MDNTLNDLKAALNAGIVKLIFEKKDGSMRTAMATTKADLIPQPTTKKFHVTDIKWDNVVDDVAIDVDLPTEADVILDLADIDGFSQDEVNDVVIDDLTEKFGFLIEGCNIAEAPKRQHPKKDGIVTFVDVDKTAWRSCNFSQVCSWESV